MEDKISQAIELLNEVIEDTTVPKNIRQICQEAQKKLEEDKPIEIKIDAATQILDDISKDPNIEMFTRTQIWNVVSLLESL